MRFFQALSKSQRSNLSFQQHTSNPRNILTPWSDVNYPFNSIFLFSPNNILFQHQKVSKRQSLPQPTLSILFNQAIQNPPPAVNLVLQNHEVSYTARTPVATSVKNIKFKKKKSAMEIPRNQENIVSWVLVLGWTKKLKYGDTIITWQKCHMESAEKIASEEMVALFLC